MLIHLIVSGKCDNCGTNRDRNQILDICKYAKDILHKVKEHKTDPIKVMELCDEAIKRQECILYPFHYLLIGTLDKAFDACISASKWDKALDYGLRTLEPYRHIYHQYHPNIGIQLFRIGMSNNAFWNFCKKISSAIVQRIPAFSGTSLLKLFINND